MAVTPRSSPDHERWTMLTLRGWTRHRGLGALVATALLSTTPALAQDDRDVIERACEDPSFRKALLANPPKALATTEVVRVIEEPPFGRVLVLPKLLPGPEGSPPTDPSARFARELAWNKKLRAKVKRDWRAAFKEAGLATPPSGKLIVVEDNVGGRTIVLPPALTAATSPLHRGPSLIAPLGTHGVGNAARCKDGPPCGPPGDPQDPPPKPTSYVTAILRIDHKRWNQNPLGPGCKNDDFVSFLIPEGATLESITMGENGCGPKGIDVPVGKYVDTHVALGIVAGGTVLNRRPAVGATGKQEISYHWWFNQWGHAQASICVNVRSKKPPSLDVSKVERYTHVNMDAGWVKSRIKLPFCFREVNVGFDLQGPIDSRDVTYRDISVGGKVAAGDNCVVEWFGCRDDRNIIP